MAGLAWWKAVAMASQYFVVLLAVYMLLIGALTAGMGVIERQLRIPGFGGQGAAR